MTPITDELVRQRMDQLRAEAVHRRLLRNIRADRRSRRSGGSSWRPAAAGALNRAAARLDPGGATGPAHPADTPAVVLVPLLDTRAITPTLSPVDCRR